MAPSLPFSVLPIVPTNASSCVIDPLHPILWFGDRDKYFDSAKKIITVGINPSNKAFVADGFNNPVLPFPLNPSPMPQAWYNAMDDYFKVNLNPDKWFKHFELILRGGGCSYGFNKCPKDISKNLNANVGAPQYTAIHIDLCSPWATTKKWNKLGLENKGVQSSLLKQGVHLFDVLIDYFLPDVILFSSKEEYLGYFDGLLANGPVNTPPRNIAPCLTEIQVSNTNGKCIYEGQIVRNNKEIKVLWDLWINTPFGKFKDDERQYIGQLI